MPFANLGQDQVYYVQQGEQGLPVLFVHGSAANHLTWSSQVHALREIARAIALDLPGHGKSGPNGRDSVSAYAEVIIQFLDALHLQQAMIVGHSLGGAIAQTVALSYPDRVAALGLVGTGARLRVLPAILEGVLSPSEFDKTAEWVTEYSYAPGLDAEMKKRALEQFRACAPLVTHGDFSACNAFDIMPRIGEIRAPTLIICGKQDRMTPLKYSEYLAASIPQAQLVSIDGAGHSVMVEKPEPVNRALDDFIRDLRSNVSKL